jgi:hypothetical protein
MRVTKPKPSGAVAQALRTGLAKFLDPGAADKLTPAALTSGEPGLPLETFTLGIEDIKSESPLKRAHYVGWRYLLSTSANEGIVVDVPVSTTHRMPQVAALQRGPHAANILEKVRDLERLNDGNGQYELALLNIPSLLVESFWLRSLGAGPDLIVPFHSLNKRVVLMRPYKADEFIQIMRVLAERRLEFRD